MYSNKDLAELIFPDINMTLEELEVRYPKRDLSSEAMVTRFAPSPTGFLHTGSLFTAMIGANIAKSSNGVFYIRLEDTDTKREIKGSGESLIDQLAYFDINPDEGYLGEKEVGKYGPYKQSERANIYKAVIKHLISIGRAYPCFCSQEELNKMREKQEEEKVIPGYYGEYAICRYIPIEEAIRKIKNNEPYVIRFKSMGNHMNKVAFTDLIRGPLELTQNDQDIVILKSDGLPTYHFAHAVDDHFMRTNCITRGEEWLSSLPIHIELFETLEFELPKYAHLPVIMKMDNGNRRKLSKRKDDEAAVSFFIEDGYPKEALIEYLMTIANSNYEEWHIENPDKTYKDFALSFDKISNDGALFDIMKLKYISKEFLSKLSKEEISSRAYDYAKKYDENLKHIIDEDYKYFESIMNIEREKENPRKDYEKFSDIFPLVKFFYDEYYDEMIRNVKDTFNPKYDSKCIKEVLEDFVSSLDLTLDESTWFNSLKEVGKRHDFAESNKIYKNQPENYIGHIGDVAEMVRITLTSSKQSPNIYAIMQILGLENIKKRVNKVIAILSI